MPAKLLAALLLVGFVLITALPAQDQTAFDVELRGLLKLHNGAKSDLDAVERLGADLLKRFEEPQHQAQIQFTLAHVHAQAAMREPAKIATYCQAGLDSKLITPGQRATLYSYWASAIEVQRDAIKEFPERRRAAAKVLLSGLGELAPLQIPEQEPELPSSVRIDIGSAPGEAPRQRAEAEAYQRARDNVIRIRDLIFRRKVLTDQVRYLYVRPPADDAELRDLATKAIDESTAEKLVAQVTAERDRIEKARREALEKAKQSKKQ
jgi:hypothetical protein